MIGRLALAWVTLILSVLGLIVPAQAQVIPAKTDVAPGERLSDWLLRQVGPNADTSALHWRVPAERATQDQLRRPAIPVLPHAPGIPLAPAARAPLAHLPHLIGTLLMRTSPSDV